MIPQHIVYATFTICFLFLPIFSSLSLSHIFTNTCQHCRGNKHDLNLINEFKSKEENMNKEIVCRSSTETFNDLEEKRYIVDSTGASISSGSSVGLLHHYCSKLPRDEYAL